MSVHMAQWGVAPAHVAEWAGHSVDVLLRTYARCLDGQHDIAKRRIEEALDDPSCDDKPGNVGKGDSDYGGGSGGDQEDRNKGRDGR